MMAEVDRARLKIRPMLSLSAATDALYAYYAFYHDRERTELHVHEDTDGRVDGFVAICQTSQRLFQPTVVLRTPKVRVAVDLLREALASGRPYYLITTPDLREAVLEVVDMPEPQTDVVYEIDLSRFEYAINVLVAAEQGIENRPRFAVRSGEDIVAEAGVAWLSPHFAGVYAQVTPAAEERGLGLSVVATCTRWVVRSGRRPLIIVDAKDGPAIALAEAAGYVDTGARELAGDIVCCL
ncbi:MAG: GNAT family N-acetyltransferase [Anaerolineae bacterium]|jgi:predicted GNAT family acetyltransferase